MSMWNVFYLLKLAIKTQINMWKYKPKAAMKNGLRDIKYKILWCELCATILANLITKTNEKIICVVWSQANAQTSLSRHGNTGCYYFSLLVLKLVIAFVILKLCCHKWLNWCGILPWRIGSLPMFM